jgi:hypothetical protein
LRSTRKTSTSQAPTWLDAAVYEPKRQRTFDLVKRAVDTLVEQRKLDGTTRISLNSIIATAKQLDPAGQGIAHTSILENEEAYAYYKRFRTASKLKKRQPTPGNGDAAPVVKVDRDQGRIRQRYMKLNREELVNQLLSVEQQYAELHERYLAVNDTLLEWQLRAEQAEAQLKVQQEQAQAEGLRERSRSSSSKPRHHQRAERTTGPLPKHLVSLLAFAQQHCVAETKVRAHMDIDHLLPVKRGEWTDTDGTMVTLALDAQGRAAFYQLYQGVPPFMLCEQCPHQKTETSGGKTKQ